MSIEPATPQRISIGQSGFSLLEVLIALVILSVGLLGLAAMQAEGLRGSSYAMQRTEVVRVVNDIADRMRANQGGLVQTAGVIPYEITASAPGTAGQTLNCADAPSVVALDCNATNMALHDLWNWKQAIAALNPGDRLQMRGSIARNAAIANRFTITVTWVDRTNANNTVLLDVQY